MHTVLSARLHHYSVTAYPNPDPEANPNPNCIPSICRTYNKSYTTARDYHVTVVEQCDDLRAQYTWHLAFVVSLSGKR